MAYNKKVKYSFGSWLGENAGDIIKTGAGTALLATGVGAPIGAGLVASGAAGLAANNLTEDPNTQAAIQTTGQVGGMVAGAKMGYAMGGNTQLTEFNNGGTHEQNPNGGIPLGQNASVEEGETKWQDYIFSDRIPTGNKKETFADASKKIQKKYTRENDTPTQKALEREMNALMSKQEMLRQEMGMVDKSQMGDGGRIQYPDGGGITDTTYVSDPNDPRLLRYNANPEKFMFNKVVLQDSTSTPKVEPSVYGDKNTLKQAVSKLPINSQGQSMQSKPISQSPKLNIPSNQYQVAMPKGYQPRWQHNPGIKGWQQAKDKEGKTIYRRVNEDGSYGPIEYAMGGRIEMAYGSEIPTTRRKFDSYSNAMEQTGLTANVNPLPLGVAPQPDNTQPITADTFNPLAGMNINKQEGQGVLQNPDTSTPVDNTKLTNDPSLDNTNARSKMDGLDYATMGAQMLPAFYNLGKGLQKSKPIQYGRLNPNLVDYSASSKVTNDAYDQQANIINESIRENATSAGQALSNKIAHSNIAAKQKADALSQIGERQSNANQQIRGSVDQSNLQVSINEEIANAQQDAANQQAVATGLGQIGQAAGTINRDRNSNRIQDETIQILGDGRQYTYVYNPVTKRREMKFINA